MGANAAAWAAFGHASRTGASVRQTLLQLSANVNVWLNTGHVVQDAQRLPLSWAATQVVPRSVSGVFSQPHAQAHAWAFATDANNGVTDAVLRVRIADALRECVRHVPSPHLPGKRSVQTLGPNAHGLSSSAQLLAMCVADVVILQQTRDVQALSLQCAMVAAPSFDGSLRDTPVLESLLSSLETLAWARQSAVVCPAMLLQLDKVHETELTTPTTHSLVTAIRCAHLAHRSLASAERAAAAIQHAAHSHPQLLTTLPDIVLLRCLQSLPLLSHAHSLPWIHEVTSRVLSTRRHGKFTSGYFNSGPYQSNATPAILATRCLFHLLAICPQPSLAHCNPSVVAAVEAALGIAHSDPVFERRLQSAAMARGVAPPSVPHRQQTPSQVATLNMQDDVHTVDNTDSSWHSDSCGDAGGQVGCNSTNKGVTPVPSSLERAITAAVCKMCALHGVAMPSCNHMTDAGYCVDIAWPARRVCIEVDGPSHWEPITLDRLCHSLATSRDGDGVAHTPSVASLHQPRQLGADWTQYDGGAIQPPLYSIAHMLQHVHGQSGSGSSSSGGLSDAVRGGHIARIPSVATAMRDASLRACGWTVHVLGGAEIDCARRRARNASAWRKHLEQRLVSLLPPTATNTSSAHLA